MLDTKKQQWDESYQRNENCVLFPKEECVKFLSRFVRAKQPDGSFVEKFSPNTQIKGLDFGCGMGRQTQLMHEFNIDAIGVDLSAIAIAKAQQASSHLAEHFKVLEINQPLPFSDNYFDIAISESVLDSMSFDLAKKAISEIDRVTNGLVFISLISSKCYHQPDQQTLEELVTSQHEQGTVQSYYDKAKIEQLVDQTNFNIKWSSLHIHCDNNDDEVSNARYFLVLDNR